MGKKLLYIKAGALVAAVAASVYCTVHFDLISLFTNRDRLIDFVNSFHALSALIFIVLQIIQVIVAFIPGEVTGFIGGYLFGPVMGALYSTIGLTLGSVIAFSFARLFGRPLVLLLVNQSYLTKFDFLMDHKGASVSALLFLMPGFPKDYLCYILGLSKMPVQLFILISTCGRLVSTVLLSVAGSLIRHRYYAAFVSLTILVVLVIFVIYLYRENIERRLRQAFQDRR